MADLKKARSRLVLDHPFFGTLALRLLMIEDTRMQTAGTDGKHLYYNPKFFEQLTMAETIGVLAHEVMHNALGHGWRRGTRNSVKWNIAGDYAINSILTEAKLALPQGALIDAKYNGKSTEEIYNLLPEDEQQQSKSGNEKGKGTGDSQFQDPGNCGISLEPLTTEEAKELESEWKVAIVQAAQTAKKIKGTLPGQLKRLIDETVEPSIPWYVLLRDFVEMTARNDYNWVRPNRRYLSSGFALPSMISEELPEVVVAVDTSGSICSKTLARFSAEASAVLAAYDTKIRIIYCDARVQGVVEYTRTDLPFALEPKGGGGTDFRPVFDYTEKEGIMPSCLIYLTDMYGRFPSKEPNYPVMWVSTTKGQKAPFGKTIEYNQE